MADPWCHECPTPCLHSLQQALPHESDPDCDRGRPDAVQAGGAIVKRLDISELDVLALMRYDACTRCGECTSTCPTGGEAQDVELVTPRGKILKLAEMYKR